MRRQQRERLKSNNRKNFEKQSVTAGHFGKERTSLIIRLFGTNGLKEGAM
jgi:hypothetical protein